MKKIAIIGSGISGMSAAHFLKTKGEVTIFEKSGKPGGLVKCDIINGHLYHKVGGHIFNSRNEFIKNWFWSFFNPGEEFIYARRNAKIWLNGKMIGYPLENYLYQLPTSDVEAIVSDLAQLLREKKESFQTSDSHDFATFLSRTFGKRLYKIYFKPYNEKIWNYSLEDIPMPWLADKLPMPDIEEILLKNILREDETNSVHSTFFYPLKGGSQFIADRLSEGLPIQYNKEINRIEFSSDQWILNNDMKFDTIVYTGDVRELAQLVKVQNDAINERLRTITGLPSNDTTNILCETDLSDVSWIYIPSSQLKPHRIINTGEFSPNNRPPKGRSSCVVEFSGKVNDNEAREELEKLPGKLSFIASNYEKRSYVIHKHDTRNQMDSLKKALEPVRFYLVGRFAEWEYYNMDKCMESAKKVADLIE